MTSPRHDCGSLATAACLGAIDDAAGVQNCFELMRQLRPQLGSVAEWLAYWQRQSAQGYRLAGVLDGSQPVALAGYRVQENLVHGRYLYVDDLVTDAAQRSRGHGERLMAHLRDQARALGCGKVILDTPLSNALGHRFYFRCGLLASSLRFNVPIEP
ncbi:GNAT family N-acetyltransferase [Paludibacterium purpuratum]|uniref:Acetyltransferase (GNAT) family protein n=1 Tax=Paludibacterium purpuratum TaxID=1144873 RepID=A0A4R7BC82_9NEIS|nr:GNAT family N-acetyltransferase [Paludibacterium purpuratum]TDR81515.1 acetyltransferase (GNAT) family protein [Paludibacterium purpuratum]